MLPLLARSLRFGKRKPRTPADIRGVADERLKFSPTSNVACLGLARMMEVLHVPDEPLIAELYRRGRAAK